MKNNRGLSTIVTTLIIILLTFVAVGIIWAVVSGVLKGGSDTIDYAAECIKINLEVTNATCPATPGTTCLVSVQRGSGGGTIGGVKIVIPNDAGTSSFVCDGLTIAQLGTVTTTCTLPTTGGWTVGTINEAGIEVKPFFLTATGEQRVC